MAKLNFQVGLNLPQQEVNGLLQQIKTVQSKMKLDFDLKNDNEAKQAFKDLSKLADALKLSINDAMGQASTTQFNKNLEKLEINVRDVRDEIESLGYEGSIAFDKMVSQIQFSNRYLEKQQTLLDKTVTTFGKTAVWSLMNKSFDAVTNSVSDAVGYIKDLDKSLNDIQIVTGKSSIEMAEFAKQANEAAKAVGQTTIAYTEGALLYLQQGKTMSEAAQLVNATLVGANITGESTADVAELLTASLNGYNLAAQDALTVTDKFAAVGAATGSDFYELATAFSKTASMASTVGVEFDKLTAQIATISTVTRESPETIGTSLKTIFARMSEISMGGSDGEYDFGAVKSQLDSVGISIVDSNNELRDMGEVIEEVGDKWDTFGRNAQVAITNAMGGKLQANRLLALFNNWEMYQEAVETASNSSGAAMEQNEIYMDSLGAHANQLQAQMEELYGSLLDSDGFKATLDIATELAEAITNISNATGGLIPILGLLAPAFAKAINPAIIQAQTAKMIKEVNKIRFDTAEVSWNKLAETMKTDSEKAKVFLKNLGIPDGVIEEYRVLAQEEKQLGELHQQYVAIQQLSSREGITELAQLKQKIQEKNAEFMIEIKRHNQMKVSISQKREQLAQMNEETKEYKELAAEVSRLEKEFIQVKKTYKEIVKESNNLNVALEMNEREFAELADQIKITGQQMNTASAATEEMGNRLKSVTTGFMAKMTKLATVGAQSAGIIYTAFNTVTQVFDEFEAGTLTTDSLVTSLSGMASSIGMSLMFINPLAGGITMAIGLFGQLASSLGLFESAAESADKKAKKLQETLSAYNDSASGLRSFAQAVKSYEESISSDNSIEAQAEALKTFNNAIAQAYPMLVKYYDELGNPVVGANYEDIIEQIDKLNEAQQRSIELSAARTNKDRNTYINAMGTATQQSTDYMETIGDINTNIIQTFQALNPVYNELDSNLKGVVSEVYNAQAAFDILKDAGVEGFIAYEETVKGLVETLKMVQGDEQLSAKFAQLNTDSKEMIANLITNYDLTESQAKELVTNLLLGLEDGVSTLSTQVIDDFFSKIMNKIEGTEIKQQLMDVFFIPEEDSEWFWKSFEGNAKGAINGILSEFKEVGDLQTLLQNMYNQSVISFEELGNLQTELLTGSLSEKEMRQEILDILLGIVGAQRELTEEDREQLELNKQKQAEQEAYQQRLKEFQESYNNPLAFSGAGDLDETIDQYQELVAANETLIELFNEANSITYKDGHPFSQKFADFIDGNLTEVEDYEEALMTFNEIFEDMVNQGNDLANTFGADLASSIEEIMSITPGTPFDDWSETAKTALEEVFDNFSTFEDQVKEMYIRLNSDNEEFYKTLRSTNAETFEVWDENFGLAGQSFQNMSEYQVAVDMWKYEQMNNLSNEDLARAYDSAVQQGIISTDMNNEIVSNQDKAEFMKRTLDVETTKNIIDNRKTELEAERDSLLAGAQAFADVAELKRDANGDMVVDMSSQLSKLDENARAQLNTFISNLAAEGILEGTGIGTVGSKGIGTITLGAFNSISSKVQEKLASINDQIGKLEALGESLTVYEGYKPEDLNFNIEAYNPTKAPTTTAGGYSPSKGSSSSSSSEKEIEDLEFVKDLYHDINIELQKQEGILSRLQNAEDDLYGQARIDNMKKQEESLKKQTELMAQKLQIARDEAQTMKDSLSKMGVKFDETGTITNYNQILQEKTNWANSLSGDAKEQAQEYVESLRSAMESYEELQFEVILDYENELEELREAIQEKILEAIDYQYKLNIEASITFQEDADFFTKFLEGYETVDERFKRTLDTFNSQVDALKAFEERYNAILDNNDLDAEAKREALEELKEDFKDSLLTLQEFYEAISNYIQSVIEDNTDKIYDQLDAFEQINDELSDMIDMYELLGKTANLEAINEALGAQISSNEAQIDLLNKAKKELEDFRDSLEEGTEEWELANEQVQKMDEDIRKLALDTVKLLQTQLENTFSKTLSDIEKALSNGLGFDKLEEEIEKTRKEQEKYYDSVEKTVWSARMLEKIQTEINNQTDPKKQEALQKFYDEEVATLLQKDKLTAAEVERAEILYDLTLKQMAVEEARANKTIMRLVRDDQGNWTYQYMTDLEAVAAAQEEVSSTLDELLAHDKKTYEKVQDEILERRKQYIKDMQALQEAYLNGEITDKEEFDRLMAELQTNFNDDMLILSQEYALAEKNIAESTLMSIMDAYQITYADLDNLTETQKQMFADAGIQLGNSWDETLRNMTNSNSNHTKDFIDSYFNPDSGVVSKIDTAFEEMSSAAGDYQNKISEVTKNAGMDLDNMANKTQTLKDKTASLKQESEHLVAQMGKEFDAIRKNLPEYDKIREAYDKIANSVKGYIDNINKAIDAQKNLASTPTPSPSTGTSSGGSSSNSSSNNSSSSTPRSPGVGDIVRSVPGTWYSDSYSGAPTGTPSKWAKEFKVTSHKTDGRPRPWHIQGTNGGTGSGWVEWVGFKSGGYTGDWAKTGGLDGEGGKAALLHQKEMVLNAEDTENMLKAVELVRDFSSLLRNDLSGIGLAQTDNSISQNVTIQADFSGVKSSSEIESAFDNLVNRAVQFANKK